MIVATMVGAGLQVNRVRLAETLRRYELWGKALIGNFVILPVIAWLAVRAFGVHPDVATGILLMAMAPGVPLLANSAGRQLGGSLAFAVTIAFLFSALSVVTIPITASILLPGQALAVPALKFLTTLLVFQLIPLLAGAALAPRLSEAAVVNAGRLLTALFLAATFALIVVQGGKALAAVASVYGSGNLIVIAIVAVCALATGYLLGGPDRDYRRTLSIATLMRNIGLCALIGTSRFEETLVVPTIIAYFIVSFLVGLPLRIYYRRTRHAKPLQL
jgi:BASS family bile acid:Na+ symporter